MRARKRLPRLQHGPSQTAAFAEKHPGKVRANTRWDPRDVDAGLVPWPAYANRPDPCCLTRFAGPSSPDLLRRCAESSR
jgi:hypothetical protein